MRQIAATLLYIALLLSANAQIISPNYETSPGQVCQTAGQYSLGCIAIRMSSGGEVLIQLLLAIAFVSGWGFVVAAIFKFKQVRENPTQVPVSTPFAFLLTAILLIFIPGLMNTSSQTVFGSSFSAPGNASQLYNTNASSSGLLMNTVNEEAAVVIESDSENNLFAMAYRVLNLFPALMSIVVGGAYIAGLGFALVAMTKLKAVKDNPQQNTPTLPLAYLAIAVLLIYIPELIAPSSETLFGSGSGDSQEQGGALGQGSDLLIS